MEAFDFAFTLFGLVLGLAMAEVLAGFVRVLKLRGRAPREGASSRSTGEAGTSQAVGPTHQIRVGWLTPAIALLVVLDLLSGWLLAWMTRGVMTLSFATLLGGTAAAALYYVAASLVWPDDPREWPDLDAWFLAHKAQIAGAIALANVGYLAILWLKGTGPAYLAQEAAYIALAALLTQTRRRWQSGTVMAAMLGLIAVGWL